MAQESTSGMFVDDEFYCLSAKRAEDEIDVFNCKSNDQICGFLLTDDSKYAEELQLQEAITASLIGNDSHQEEEREGVSSFMGNNSTKEIGESSHSVCVEDRESDEMVNCSHSFCSKLQLQETSTASLIKNDSHQEEEQEGESSMMGTSTKESEESSRYVCAICVEDRESDEMVSIQNCSHSFCSDCVTKHVTVKIEEKNVERKVFVRCPGLDCSGNIELDTCKSLIPKEVFDRWNEALVESMIEASQKFYCPFKDCSALLVNDSGDDGAVITASECPECNRLFCAQCYVPWHSDVDCEELQRLNSDERGNEDRLVRQLAKEKSWMRCPTCKYYVEKTQGCLHMTCRCGSQFCYACGELWSKTHGGCRP